MAEKELDFGDMLNTDPAYLDSQKRRVMAQALLEQLMKRQAPAFRRNPLAVGLDFLTARDAKTKAETAQREQMDMMRQLQEQEQSERQQFATGIQEQDPRAAIARALASRFPGLQKLGENHSKANQEMFTKLVDAGKDRLDWGSVLPASGGGGFAGGLRLAPPLAPPKLMSGTGPDQKTRSWIEHQKLNGEFQVHPLSDPAKTEVNLNPQIALGEKKVGWDVLNEQGKFYAPGGKGYEQGQKHQEALQHTSDMLQTLSTNPGMGAGAEGFQFARKWLETLGGKPIALTGNTDQMKAQLAQNVISTLGGLGAQISDKDREFMMDAVGRLDTDPAALRRILLVAARAHIMKIQKLKAESEALSKHPAYAEQGVTFPGFGLNNFTLPKQDMDDLDLIMGGKLPQLRRPDGVVPAPASRIRKVQ